MNKKRTILIMTVGGTPEPLVKSIQKNKPDLIYFIASKNPEQEGEEKDEKHKGSELQIPGILDQSKYSKEYRVKLVEDPDNLQDCQQVCQEALKDAFGQIQKQEEAQVYVDITGGTKVMAASLLLESIEYKVKYIYIGGKRNKEGTGTVQSGTEKVIEAPNPWERFARLEMRRIKTLLGQYEYTAVLDILDELQEKDIPFQESLAAFRELIEMLAFWDLFNYSQAHGKLERIEAAFRKQAFGQNDFIKNFANECRGLLDFLKELREEQKKQNQMDNEFAESYKGSGMGGIIPEGRRPDYAVFLYDLLANAGRRAKQGKYDDAVLRLYRMLEMIAQDLLLKNYGILSGKVPLAFIENLSDGELKKRLLSKAGENGEKKEGKKATAKIALEESWNLVCLLEPDLPLIQKWRQEKDLFRKVQSSRNDSFLAHGFVQVKFENYQNLKNFVLSLGYLNESRRYQFPRP